MALRGPVPGDKAQPQVDVAHMLLKSFSPNSDGWIAEIAYIPFVSSQAPGWPWFNARVGVQYTWYNKFDGTIVGASANNTLFVYLWLAM